jgi:hypothetical protein
MEGDNYGGSLKRRESGRDREGEQDWSIRRGLKRKLVDFKSNIER